MQNRDLQFNPFRTGSFGPGYPGEGFISHRGLHFDFASARSSSSAVRLNG